MTKLIPKLYEVPYFIKGDQTPNHEVVVGFDTDDAVNNLSSWVYKKDKKEINVQEKSIRCIDRLINSSGVEYELRPKKDM